MPERRKLDLGSEKKAKQERKASGGSAKRSVPKETDDGEKLKAKSKQAIFNEDDEDDDEDDEEFLDGLENQSGTKSKLLLPLIGVGVVVVVVIAFLLLKGGHREQQPPDTGATPPAIGEQQPEQSAGPAGPVVPGDVGTTDFTQDTNMSNSEILTNPDMFVEDLYGLTTRVDYTVKSITSVADFVSYTKHRGTWGGGLELYWLDVEYKENKYVVQVPFQYYKELDDVGIVPVKMEVLSIEGSVAGEYLTVISYMQLDEEVLKQVLKAQTKN